MNTRLCLRIALLAPAALGFAGPLVRAEDPPAPALAEDGLVTAFQGLGATPNLEAVLRIARKAQLGESPPAHRLADLMTSHGGHACAAGLRALVRHRDADVRIAALRGVAQLQLRAAVDMDVVRAARDDADPAVRDAAYAAVGAVGDATDVPPLLEALASTDARVVAAAFAALRDLSGARLRCRAPLWRQWWRESQERAPGLLFNALATLENGRDADAAAAQAVVVRNAWIRLGDVQIRVMACLRAETLEQRRAGYRLAADLRLADLAEPLAAALVWERDADCLRVGLESAKALGVGVATR